MSKNYFLFQEKRGTVGERSRKKLWNVLVYEQNRKERHDMVQEGKLKDYAEIEEGARDKSLSGRITGEGGSP